MLSISPVTSCISLCQMKEWNQTLFKKRHKKFCNKSNVMETHHGLSQRVVSELRTTTKHSSLCKHDIGMKPFSIIGFEPVPGRPFLKPSLQGWHLIGWCTPWCQGLSAIIGLLLSVDSLEICQTAITVKNGSKVTTTDSPQQTLDTRPLLVRTKLWIRAASTGSVNWTNPVFNDV